MWLFLLLEIKKKKKLTDSNLPRVMSPEEPDSRGTRIWPTVGSSRVSSLNHSTLLPVAKRFLRVLQTVICLLFGHWPCPSFFFPDQINQNNIFICNTGSDTGTCTSTSLRGADTPRWAGVLTKLCSPGQKQDQSGGLEDLFLTPSLPPPTALTHLSHCRIHHRKKIRAHCAAVFWLGQ